MKKLFSLVLALALVLSTFSGMAFAETTYNEAPMLAEKVAAGELPPVAERLPENPDVYTVAEVGKYGGTWTQATPEGTRSHAHSHMTRYLDLNGLYNNADKVMVGSWISDWSNNEDYTEFTFTLRKGLKWSDGDDVTTEDVAFWWNDILKNTEYTASDSYYYDATLEIVDDITFKFIFEAGKPMYYTYWVQNECSRFVYPSHYLKQFHPTYAEDIDAVLAAEGYDDWKTMMEAKASAQNNPDLPCLGPWDLTVDPAETNTLVYTRNPYYWAVDQEGNQLPYIDECIINVVESTDLMNGKIIAGEIDYQAAGLSESFSNYPLFAQHMEEQGYSLWTTPHNEPGALNFSINVTSADAVKGPILADVRFRQALSLGMDRDSIIATFYSIGPYKSLKAQFSFLEDSPWYSADWANAYINFDAAAANALLDEMGLNNYDANGWRTAPDGSELSMTCINPTYDAQWAEVAEMVCSHWRENLKLNINLSAVDPSLWGQTINSGEWEITDLTGTGFNGFLALTTGVVSDWTASTDSVGWGCFPFVGAYLKEGENKVEPTEDIARLNELGKLIVIETDEATRDAYINEIAEIWGANIYTLGIGRRLPAIIVVKDYVKNVTEAAHGAGWNYGANGCVRADGIWFDK